MNIRIYKCPDKELKKQIKNLAILTLETIVPSKRVLDNTSVSIKLDHKFLADKNAWGMCWWNDKNVNPRDFSIVIDENLCPRAFKKTLIHELIHIKQYLLKELKDFSSGQTKWKSEIFEESEDYKVILKFPWEKEAYKLSEKLYIRLCT
jgi:hypothetical protein